MGNFDFVKAALPALADECARAESYVVSDPRSACFYGRRAVELLVDHLYDVLGLALPYKDDLAAKTNDPAFKQVTGLAINAKLNLIRKLGNDAVHKPVAPAPRDAVAVLREVFHVMIWATIHHSPHPGVAPAGLQFDPQLAAKAAPLTREQVQQLAVKFRKQDEDHRAELALHEEKVQALEAEMAALKAQIAAAQATAPADTHDYGEEETRDLFVDVLLREAGWTILDKGALGPFAGVASVEYEVTAMPNGQGVGYVDYVLWGTDGKPLAVVEAKRTRKDPALGERQAELYADRLEAMTGRRPIIYFTNGYEHWLWDDTVSPKREVAGFGTADELELMVQQRSTRQSLSDAVIDSKIVERHYQQRAIKSVTAVFEQKERAALLVMATGSGKTRTVIALVKLLQERGWVKRVLFLADRVALVNQAARAFREHLPGTVTVNLVTEREADGARVYISTYPTMMGLIDEVDDAGRRFGPEFFDLVVIDEAHRSVYAKYGEIFRYFDSLLVGLTATPKDEIDHNTYDLFHLETGVPTDAYSLEEAVRDRYLVPPRHFPITTDFMRQGIKYDDLPETDKARWDEADWGEGGWRDQVQAAELNRFLFNADTVDKVLAALMEHGYRVEGGDRIGKTIIFAANQEHAEFIRQRFDLAYPDQVGKTARVITFQSGPYAQTLIDDFSDPVKQPDIAISVDMLDTGIDVPEVVNLVFFRMVRSKSKFWQMLGRGTRLRPDLYGPGLDKQDFLVFDLCKNLEYFSVDPPGGQGQVQKSLSQRLFEARVSLAATLGATRQEQELRASTVDQLNRTVASMSLDNFLVRPHRALVERFGHASAWATLSKDDADLAASLGALPSKVRDTDESAKRFDLLILRAQLSLLDGDTAHFDRLRATIQDIAAQLVGMTNIPAVQAQVDLIQRVATDDWWADVPLNELENVRLKLRGLLHLVTFVRQKPVFLDIEDALLEAEEIHLPGISPGMDWDRFKEKAAAYLRAHEDDLALQRLRRGKAITAADIEALERMLVDAGGDVAVIQRAEGEPGGLGAFIRGLVGLEREAVQESFSTFLAGTTYTADQIRFVGLVVDELTRNGTLEIGRLYESPFADNGGPERLFAESEVDAIVTIIRTINNAAVPGPAA